MDARILQDNERETRMVTPDAPYPTGAPLPRAPLSGPAGRTEGEGAERHPGEKTSGGRAYGNSGPDLAGVPQRDGAPTLGALPLPRLRQLRGAARREEADLSYLRRLLQGRIDILRAELARRAVRPHATGPVPAPPGPPEDLLTRLPEILATAPSRVRSSARHITVTTPHGEEYRKAAEAVLGGAGLLDLAACSDDELRHALDGLIAYEREVSGRRRRVQRTVDDCGAEIARRYRDGEAHVEDLLSEV